MLTKTALKQAVELELCKREPLYFIEHYVKIYDSLSKDWIPFHLWDFQKQMITQLHSHPLHIWLKARQIGATWLTLAYELWMMQFDPIASVLNFSLRETEAVELISEQRLRGMHKRLPDWMRQPLTSDNARSFTLANGSVARAFSTSTGDSYTATLAIIDEADLVPDLDTMLRRIKPTIDAGGKLVLLSRVDKLHPNSMFKQIWKQARLGQNQYQPFFVAWDARPDRGSEWYADQVKNAITLDSVHEQYPATEEEALSLVSRGRIYPNFTLEENVSELAEYDANYPVEWWVDVGWDDPTVILLAQWKPMPHNPECVCVFGEYRYRQTLDENSIRQTIQASRRYPTQVIFDSAAPSFGGAMIKVRDELGLITRVMSADKSMGVMEGIQHVRYYIGTEHLPKRLIIHPRCATLINDVMLYHKSKDEGDVKPEHDEYSHANDAIRYGLSQTFYKVQK